MIKELTTDEIKKLVEEKLNFSIEIENKLIVITIKTDKKRKIIGYPAKLFEIIKDVE